MIQGLTINDPDMVSLYESGMPIKMLSELTKKTPLAIRSYVNRRGITRDSYGFSKREKLNRILDYIEMTRGFEFSTYDILEYMGGTLYTLSKVTLLLSSSSRVDNIGTKRWCLRENDRLFNRPRPGVHQASS